jgi:FtsH-binding integral membrane protein
MRSVSEESSEHARRQCRSRIAWPALRVWYFLPLGLLSAAAVFAFAMLPPQMGGVVSLVTIVSSMVIERRTRRYFDPRPRGAIAIAYFVFSGVVFVGSLVLVATVARGDALWLAGLLAGVVFVVVSAAIWMPIARPVAHEAVSGERG